MQHCVLRDFFINFAFSVDQVLIDPSDVIILDEIVNDANGRATFLVFVYLKNPTDVLSGKILQASTSCLYRENVQ